jgi:hypothetical protein
MGLLRGTRRTLLGGRRAAVGPRWFNPLDSAAIDARIAAGGYWAWRAQANDNVTWGPGPPDYATSRISVEGNLVTLIEGNGAVPWAGATGWGFLGQPANQYFNTAVTATGLWCAFIQYSNNAVNVRYLCGAESAGARSVEFIQIAPNMNYGNGGLLAAAPIQVTGNLSIIGANGYRNGVLDGVIPGGGIPPHPIFIGCSDGTGAPTLFAQVEIQAFILCDTPAAITAADRLAIAALPAGSMHNL